MRFGTSDLLIESHEWETLPRDKKFAQLFFFVIIAGSLKTNL
jgi:hypothetical protein